MAADLKHRVRLSYRKVVELFDSHFGLRLSAATLVRAGQRLAHFAEGTCQRLIHGVQASSVVYAAERALRPSVINCKLSTGNRSPTGANTHSILVSLAQTARQNGCDFVAAARTILGIRDERYIEPLIAVLA